MSSRRSKSLRQLVEQIERLDILGFEAARLRKALARMDIRPRIQDRQIAGMVVIDRDLEKRLLARRHLAAAVGRERPEQPRDQIRAPLCHFVVDRHRAGQRRQPARFRGLQAQQPDDIARIGVEMLALGRLVGAHVRVRCREAQIADMAQEMPLRVLRPGVAEIRADAPIGCRAVGDGLPSTGRPRISTKPRPSRISCRIASSRGPSVGSGKSARLISAMSRPRSRTRAVALSTSAISAAERDRSIRPRASVARGRSRPTDLRREDGAAVSSCRYLTVRSVRRPQLGKS